MRQDRKAIAEEVAKRLRTEQLGVKRTSRLNLLSAIAERGQRSAGAMPRAAYAIG